MSNTPEWTDGGLGPDNPEYYLDDEVEGASYLDDEYDREVDYWKWSDRL